MIKSLTAALALTALASLAAAAEPTTMSDTDLDQVVAGWKGNNGWGNGYDGITPGSDDGLTAPSKTCNCSTDGGVNVNPTTSDGR